MSRWMCGKCGKIFTYVEWDELKRVPLNPEEPDPWKGSGFTRVCDECGYVFHRDKWHLVEDVVLKTYVGKVKVRVSTVFLELEHFGGMWYETMLFPEAKGDVKVECWYEERYATREEAERGHRRVLEKLRKGRWELIPDTYRLMIL